jgi:hypothetical protein
LLEPPIPNKIDNIISKDMQGNTLLSQDMESVALVAKLVVYPDEPEEYFTFMIPEAFNAVKEWILY